MGPGGGTAALFTPEQPVGLPPLPSDRLGVHTTESGIPFAVDLFHGGLAARQQRPDITLARPVHRLMQDAQAGRLDRRQVDQAIELRRIGGLRIEDLDLSLALSIIET